MSIKLCFITGTRAEYGLLHDLMKAVDADPRFHLQIVVTGMHLAPAFGRTDRQILSDGFIIDRRVEMLLDSDSPVGTTKSMALGLIGFGEAFEELQPDLIILLGDRFEMLAASASALVHGIPIAHIHGGEITAGAFDDAVRHAITQMSHLHFVSTETYRRRVIQLGVQPDRVFTVGALGVERMKKMELLDRPELEKEIGFKLISPLVLVAFHPTTGEPGLAEVQTKNLLRALYKIDRLQIIFTGSNADPEGRCINQLIQYFVKQHPKRAIFFRSMGQRYYLSALRLADAVVGNSSSGIIEAASFCTPVVNIGTRQQGRVRPDNVVDCGNSTEEIQSTIERLLSPQFMQCTDSLDNPYEKPGTTESILDHIAHSNKSEILHKLFFDLPDDVIEAIIDSSKRMEGKP